jgi:hypothetical protein
MIAWHLYATLLYCFNNKQVIHKPAIIFPGIYFLFILNCTFHLLWLFLQDYEHLWYSTIISLCMTIVLIYCVIYGLHKLHIFIDKKKNIIGIKKHIHFTIFIIYNGIALYMIWASLMTIFNLGTAIVYENGKHNWEMYQSSLMCIILIIIEIILFLFLDYFILMRFTRYVIAPYFMFLWIASGLVKTNANNDNNILLFSVGTFILSCLFSFCKSFYLITIIVEKLNTQPINKYSMYTYSLATSRQRSMFDP